MEYEKRKITIGRKRRHQYKTTHWRGVHWSFMTFSQNIPGFFR
jgi:hypothetical protein